MNEYRIRLDKNGRIVIPAACRRQLQLESGEELLLHVENNQIHLFSLKHSLKKAQALIKQHAKNQSLVKKLLFLRRGVSRNSQ